MCKLNLLYCTRMCTEEMYRDLFKESSFKPAQQAQKYHRTLFGGFCNIDDVNAMAISSIPINGLNFGNKFFKGSNDRYNGQVHYISEWNIPILRNLSQTINGNRFIRKSQTRSNTVCVIDVLNVSYNLGILNGCKRKGIPVIGIVTDLPDILYPAMNRTIRKKSADIIDICDGYVFLTEPMNTVINKKMKPYVIIEGQVDYNMQAVSNLLENKDDPSVILYSGSLHKINGIEYLIRGFVEADLGDVELHIYGDGDFSADLVKICEIYNEIKYFGTRLINEVVEAQIKATLLVNPRPTNQEFVKYSFPSKNMEYMASGTPLLTTKLPGMSHEYNSYVYLIDEETPAGMSRDLRNIFSRPNLELHKKGQQAKKFVMEYKNSVIQAEKILELAQMLC